MRRTILLKLALWFLGGSSAAVIALCALPAGLTLGIVILSIIAVTGYMFALVLLILWGMRIQ